MIARSTVQTSSLFLQALTKTLLTSFVCWVLAFNILYAQVTLVKDINPGTNDAAPSYLTDLNGTLIFRATSDSFGYELWKSDGTETGTVLVKDIVPGSGSSYPWKFFATDSFVFFSADNGTTGSEPWRTDGTEAGTILLKDIYPGSFSSSLGSYVTVNGLVFFTAEDTTGTNLWRTDGTPAGTFKIEHVDFAAGPGGPSPTQLLATDTVLFFNARDQNSNRLLWKTDGTSSGTQKVGNLPIGSEQSYVRNITNVNGALLFALDTTAFGFFTRSFLWKSDGTTAGTQLIKELGNIDNANSSDPEAPFTVMNGSIYFRGDIPPFDNGTELWKSDGTPGGTLMVEDINPGPGESSYPNSFNVIDDLLYFIATDGSTGYELWKSDGTSSGTQRVKDITPGGDHSFFGVLKEIGGTIYFRVRSHVTYGTELWKTDGTEAGTMIVKDIFSGTGGTLWPYVDPFEIDGTVYFTANNDTNGTELWTTDGTASGTQMVEDIYAGSSSSTPFSFVLSGGKWFFTATDSLHGKELRVFARPTCDSIVTNTNDSGPGSLRQAVATICNGGVITFDSSLTNQTITLSSPINKSAVDFTIQGLGRNNLSVSGGGLVQIFDFDSAGITINDLTLTDGNASGSLPFPADYNGGAIDASNTILRLNRVTIKDSDARDYGGGIRLMYGALFSDEVHFDNNTAADGGGGAQLKYVDSFRVSRSSFVNNETASRGAGIWIEGNFSIFGNSLSGKSSIEHSTFSNNSVTNSGSNPGGGIRIDGFSPPSEKIELNSLTVINNSASYGGGMSLSPGIPDMITIRNSIVANNTSTSTPVYHDLHSLKNSGNNVLESLGNNLFGDTTHYYQGPSFCYCGSIGLTTDSTDQYGNLINPIDPILDTLQFISGLPVHPLLCGSPAIDMGSGTEADQLGQSVFGAAKDIGAYELQTVCLSCVENPVVINTNDSGPGSLRQAVEDACEGDTITFVDSLMGKTITLTSGEIVLDKTLTIIGLGQDSLFLSASGLFNLFGTPSLPVDFDFTLRDITIENITDASALFQGYFDGDLSFDNVSLRNISRDFGVTLLPSCDTLLMTNCIVDGCDSVSVHHSGTSFFENCSFTNNSTLFNSRALITIYWNASFSNCFFANNDRAIYFQSGGPPEDFSGPPVSISINNSTFVGNDIAVSGDGSALVDIDNCTFSDNNSALSVYTGLGFNCCGGSDQDSITEVSITSSTFTANGTGIRTDTLVKLQNVIVAGNQTDLISDQYSSSIKGHFNSQGYNLIGDTTGSDFILSIGDIVGNSASPVDPLLDTLADNGGLTQTHALLCGSPAIDAGTGSGTDQIGQAVFGVAKDIGAYEKQTVCTSEVKANIKAFLGGAYDGSLMRDDLRTAGYIPLNEPYTGIFTHYAPGGGEVIDTSVLLVSDSNAIVDWVFVELRDKTDSTIIVATRSALIQRDGDVVDIDGISTLSFTAVTEDDYYVVVRHRNHLGVMTAAPVALSSTALDIDFTDPGTSTYGTDAQQAVAGTMVLWSGNVFLDEAIKYSGQDNDRDEILVRIGGVVPTNVVSGYYAEDVNRDGLVRYSGVDNDRDIILQNIGGVVPTATILEQLPE